MMDARATSVALLAVVLAPALLLASTRYDPRLRFRTITTPRFDIHFHQGEEAQARRLAVLAEEVAAALDSRLGRPAGRVHVILVNQTDLSNGWATPLFNNVIEITAARPAGHSPIGNTDDWIRVVFTHEYTHIVHLGRATGWIGGLRQVFGRMPLLFPNLFTPQWQIEGVATYEESAVTGAGRVRAGDFRMIAEHAAGTPAFLGPDRAGGGLLDWPAGHAAYAYGGLFHEFLAKRYGEDALRRLTDRTAGYPPYFGALAFKGVFRRSVGSLWDEFEAELRRGGSEPAGPSPERLTHHGFTVTGPRFASDGRLYYSVVTPHDFPSLTVLAPGSTEPRTIARRYLGTQIGLAGERLVFDQFELVAQVGLQSDLYRVDREGGGPARLTRGARAADPDVSPDGTKIMCTIQRADGRGLAIVPLSASGAGAPALLDAEPFTDWSTPRWSPDGRLIAAERRTLGGSSAIVLVDPSTGAARTLSASESGRNVTPSWSRDGRHVLFASDRAGAGFEIHRAEVETGALAKLRGTGAGAQWPEISPDGETLVFVGYTRDGYDLFSLPIRTAAWDALGPEAPGPARRTSLADSAPADRPYSPISTLLPRFWTPTLESDNGELVVGAATAGYDALGRHAYGIEGGWSAERARPDWRVAYAYDRWWPTVFAEFADDTDPFRDGEVRTRELDAGLLAPVRRVRWVQAMLLGIHASRDAFTCTGCTPEDAQVDRRAIRAGWLVDAARAYGYSISEEEGWSAEVTLELTRQALGADGDGGAATADVRGYLQLGPRHAVLAARVAAASAWGDEAVRRVFTASGHGPDVRGFEFGSDAIGLLRGVDEGRLRGSHAAVVNVDYRVPLRRIDRGPGTLPVFARTVHAAVFADVGHAWDGAFTRRDVTRSVGAELSLDAVLGYALPLTFTGGAAFRTIPPGSGGLVFFGRIGRAF
jgi:hypothetical protein